MTKRACPFEVGILRQFKIHINNWECDKASKKEVENKTLEKLFSAQKSKFSLEAVNNNSINNKNKSKDSNYDSQERKLFQKQVVSYLSNPTVKVVEKFGNDLNRNERMISCSYCESDIGNIYTCHVCCEKYCQNCSFADYSTENDEMRICMTCC